MTDDAGAGWPLAYARALGLELAEADVGVVLGLARTVAHGSERRFAPLAAFVAGRYVATRVAAGDAPEEALADAVVVAQGLLPPAPAG